MRKLFYTAFAVFALVITGCSSDNSDSNGDDNNDNGNDTPIEAELFLNYTLNGTHDVETNPSTSYLENMLLVRGDFHSGNTHHSVSLWMPATITVGTHPFEQAAQNQAVYSASTWVGNEIVDASQGALVITNITEDFFEGTFTFTGTNQNGTTGTVTSGTFRAAK